MKSNRIIMWVTSTILGVLLAVGMVGIARGYLLEPVNHPTLNNHISQTDVASSDTILVGLMTDEAGLADMMMNWVSYQGLLRAESELGVVGTVYTPINSLDYDSKLQQCVDDGNDLCISVGFLAQLATMERAIANPGTYFAIVDWSWDSYPANLRGMRFYEKESGYLAGTLAGLMNESDVIGVIGGWSIVPAVVDFVEGYRNGAQCANPAIEVLVEYAETFGDPDLGAELAQYLIGQGADVIFAPAGGTGFGAVLSATQSGVWGLGTDTDWYISVFEDGAVDGSDKLLSSALKQVDNGVFDTISAVVFGTFTSGTVLYNLELDGVGLASFHEADPYVSQDVRDAIADVIQGIINGTIDINYDCRIHKLLLPIVVRQ